MLRSVTARATTDKMTKALVTLANGAEEMEAVITIDLLRRAGIDTTVASLADDLHVACSRHVVVKADCTLADAVAKGPFDAIVLPGGATGAKNLASSHAVKELLHAQNSDHRLIAAICAAPIALLSHGIGLGKKITSHPSVRNDLQSSFSYSEDRVVRDGNIITSRGPGTAFEFSFEIINALLGKEALQKVIDPLVLHPELKH